jgi:Polyketide cyclase / dehydrase and lipid transport
MATYRARVTSPRPPAEVFDYMARFSNAAKWDPGVIDATEAYPGAPALGSTYRLVVRALGRAVPLEYRIAEFDRPRRVVLSAQNWLVRSTDVIEVCAAPGNGSTLTYDAALVLRGPAAMLTSLLGLSFRRIGDRAIVGLRTALAA